MATSLKFYTDAALTTELTTLDIDQLPDGSSPDVDKVVYLGSVTATSVFKATSDPGVDQISVGIVDANVASGIEATNIKLALTSGGLAGAVAGANLDVGTQINGGVGNAVAVYVRSDTPVLAVTDTDITLETNNITETL